MTLRLLDLPAELVVQCVVYLRLGDIQSLLRVGNRLLSSIICDSLEIRFLAQQERAHVEENPRSVGSLSVAERMELLRMQEDRRLDFHTISRYKITPPNADEMTTPWYLLEGEALVAAGREKRVHGTYFPSEATCILGIDLHDADADSDWRVVYSGQGSSQNVVGFNVALAEHDLVAVVTHDARLEDDTCTVAVQLIKFSSGAPHPSAAKPEIHIHTGPVESLLEANLKIVGRTIGVCIFFDDDEDRQYLYLFDWMRGEPLAPRIPIHSLGFGFLSGDIIMFSPRSQPETFQVLNIRLPDSLSQTVTLCLPRFIRTDSAYGYHSIIFTRDPLPRKSGAAAFQRPAHARFHPTAHNTHLFVSFNLGPTRGSLLDQSKLIVRADALLAFVFERMAIGGTGTEGDDAPRTIEWMSWGPQLTRFIDTTGFPDDMLGSMLLGQRLMTIDRGSFGEPAHLSPIHILDFNPHSVHRFSSSESSPDAEADSQQKQNPNANTTCRVVTDPYAAAADPLLLACFGREQLVSEVPYVHFVTKEGFEYNVVHFMDQGVVGLKLNGEVFDLVEVLRFA